MTRDLILDEYLAEALAIERSEGAHAFDYIAGRIFELIDAGDVDGLQRFHVIAEKWEELQRGTVQ